MDIRNVINDINLSQGGGLYDIPTKLLIGAALLTDLSKAFDCLDHDLMIAKLHADGSDESSLTFISSYLTGRNQRTKIGNSYSPWTEIVSGVPQGSILGQLLFNIYINDLFLFLEKYDIVNYADDNTPFSCGMKIEEVISKLEENFCILPKWFKLNCLQLNDDKSHLLASNHTSDININVGANIIICSASVKLLGVRIDNTNLMSTYPPYAIAQTRNYMP